MTLIKAIALTALLAAIAFPAKARDANFVAPTQSRLLEILPDPPAPDSAAWKSDFAELHAIETARTDAEVAQANWDEDNEHIFLFANVLGEDFTAGKLPAVAALGQRIKDDDGLNVRAAKEGFHRPRPYATDPTLHPVCKQRLKDDSYPSGHTTFGYTAALVLIDMLPELREAILERADAFAHSRLVCGAHHPSDLVAGRLAAYTIHAMMALNPDYQAELATARAELREKLGFK